MKIILIHNCQDCPHGARWNLEGTEYICSQLRKVNNHPEKPLSECRLDDAMDKIEELLKR